MRTGTEIGKLALGIEADNLILRQVLDQFHFVRLVFLLKIRDRLIPRHRVLLNFQIFLDDLLHLRLDLLQIIRGKRRLSVHVIVESVCDGRTDRQLCLRIQSLDGLGHNVGCGVTERPFAFLIVKCQDIKLAVMVDHGTQIHCLPVNLALCRYSCKPFTDIQRDLIHALWFLILFE